MFFPLLGAVVHRLFLASKLRACSEEIELVMQALQQFLLAHGVGIRRVIGQDFPESVENLCHHVGLGRPTTFDLQAQTYADLDLTTSYAVEKQCIYPNILPSIVAIGNGCA